MIAYVWSAIHCRSSDENAALQQKLVSFASELLESNEFDIYLFYYIMSFYVIYSSFAFKVYSVLALNVDALIVEVIVEYFLSIP